MYFGLLREEFRERGTRDSLRAEQYRQLAKIKSALETGGLPSTEWLQEPVYAPQEKQERALGTQVDLVRRIHYEGLESLRKSLGEKVELYNLEHPCPPYGAVDMVYMGSDTAYPLEVKKDHGGHDLIGQIMKYDLFFKMRLHYGHYRYVQAVTLCGTYDGFALRELKKMGVRTLKYSTKGPQIRITEA